MKKIIISMVMSMVLLTGCGSMKQDAIGMGLDHNVEQAYLELPSDIIAKLEKAGVDFHEYGEEYYFDMPGNYEEDLSFLMPGSYEDEYGRVNFLTDELLSSGRRIVNQITIESQWDLSQHPVVKVLAQVMEEEKVLAWVANQEKQVIETNQKEVIQEFLVQDKNYIFFEYFPGSEIRTLEFVWAPKPSVPEDFKEIAQRLEGHGLLTTGYIEGVGGQTLIATNSNYWFLEKMRYQRDKETPFDKGQAVTYKVMLDGYSKYSVQLYGYMDEDLSYKTKVEKMPGVSEVMDLIKMDQKGFSAITEKINEELTNAREILNDNLQREYYSEGDIGEYHYTVMVPEGIGMYNFTVLIESR